MTLTNAQRADLIDALQIAADDLRCLIDSTTHPDPKQWTKKERTLVAEHRAQIRRFTVLRRALLAEERSA